MKTLIVDDDYGTRHLMLVNLSPFGKCSVAKTGMEAVYLFQEALWSSQRFDLICMDINMPLMDGTKALKKIREVEDKAHIKGNNRVKILMITGDDDPKKVMESMKLEADKYIKKPIRKNKLLAVVNSLELI
ncbi:MAG: PleD family two-component system response regulator [Candidatus Zixiibacteriota bacterium]